jgi:hypothetical protein
MPEPCQLSEVLAALSKAYSSEVFADGDVVCSPKQILFCYSSSQAVRHFRWQGQKSCRVEEVQNLKVAVVPCGAVEFDRRFKIFVVPPQSGRCPLLYKSSVDFYKSALRNIAEDDHLHACRCKNVKYQRTILTRALHDFSQSLEWHDSISD